MVKTEEILNSKSLSHLNKLISICKKCVLYKIKTCDVPGDGSSKAKVLFIGEAPGREEDFLGKPFVGRAGKFLDFLFSEVGIKRKDMFITNLVKHRPPKNRKPRLKEINACFPYLEKQIEIIKPNLIILLGEYPLKVFFKDKEISETHGKFLESGKALYLSLYHPAAAIYNQKLKNILIRDFKKIKNF